MKSCLIKQFQNFTTIKNIFENLGKSRTGLVFFLFNLNLNNLGFNHYCKKNIEKKLLDKSGIPISNPDSLNGLYTPDY